MNMENSNIKGNRAIYRIMEQLLEVDNIEEALAGALTAIVDILDSEAGAIWLLDRKTERLQPVFHIGPADISNISIENGFGTEGVVTKTGESVMISDCENDPRFTGTVFDDQGLKAKSLICVPLNDLHESIGCVTVINKKNGQMYDKSELDLCEKMAALAAITIEEKGLKVNLDTGEKKVIIKLEDVIKEFPSGDGVSRILKGINLEIYENEFVVVLGESGCGKSTMMNIIGGMDFLTEGKLTIEGRDFSHPTDADLTEYRRNYVGFVFQSYNLMPNLTAKENIDFIAEICPDPIPSEEALDKVGLLQKANNYPAQMSGGQQQRVSIARALAKNPKVILADEPTAALDFTTGQEVLRVFESIVKNHGTTVLMITHNVEIAKMANRVIKLKGGRVASIKTNMNPLTADEISW